MLTALIVDDALAIREIIEQILRKDGYAVDIISPRQVDIAVIKTVRERFPGARILAITGGGRHGLAE